MLVKAGEKGLSNEALAEAMSVDATLIGMLTASYMEARTFLVTNSRNSQAVLSGFLSQWVWWRVALPKFTRQIRRQKS